MAGSDLKAEVARLRAECDALRGAISWLMPPFVDETTPVEEIRKRIRFMLDDAARADSPPHP